MHWEVPIHDIFIATIRYIAKHCTHNVLHKAFGFLLVKRFLCHFIVNLVVQNRLAQVILGFALCFWL
nr:MAG TPA: hypothetical protein [Caudoviricetes sp.]